MLIGLKQAQLRIGTTALLDHADFALLPQERVALVGRNGAGKSTLLRILQGSLSPDDGERIVQDGIRIAMLEQNVPQQKTSELGSTVLTWVYAGLGHIGRALSLQHSACETQQTEAFQTLTEHNAWHMAAHVEAVLDRFQLEPQAEFSSLSGGMKRRVLMARAWALNPEVLLLDEPTNHLDIPSIEFLEKQLQQFKGAVVFISHDRAFVERVATAVVDLDRGHLQRFNGTYPEYLRYKTERLANEEKAQALFDKKLAEEEIWIRRGVEARRTRNEGRVRALMAMRETFASRRKLQGTARMHIEEAEQSGKMVLEVNNLTVMAGHRVVTENWNTVVLRGERIALLGPNGIGKTTLLRALLGQTPPHAGRVRMGTRLHTVYLDQLRSQFNESDTAVDIVGAGREFVTVNGKPKHVLSYLQDFLFTANRARQPVASLSGGERARVLLAQLFAQPSNVMVLDEPSNDLDTETLELLEDLLAQYQGTLILVSHDRQLIDQVATRCWVLSPGKLDDYVGGYSDWVRQRSHNPWLTTPQQSNNSSTPSTPTTTKTTTATATPSAQAKLSFKEKQELSQLPGHIASLEVELATLTERLQSPEFYTQAKTEQQTAQTRLSQVQHELDTAMDRWITLEQRNIG